MYTAFYVFAPTSEHKAKFCCRTERLVFGTRIILITTTKRFSSIDSRWYFRRADGNRMKSKETEKHRVLPSVSFFSAIVTCPLIALIQNGSESARCLGINNCRATGSVQIFCFSIAWIMLNLTKPPP